MISDYLEFYRQQQDAQKQLNDELASDMAGYRGNQQAIFARQARYISDRRALDDRMGRLYAQGFSGHPTTDADYQFTPSPEQNAFNRQNEAQTSAYNDAVRHNWEADQTRAQEREANAPSPKFDYYGNPTSRVGYIDYMNPAQRNTASNPTGDSAPVSRPRYALTGGLGYTDTKPNGYGEQAQGELRPTFAPYKASDSYNGASGMVGSEALLRQNPTFRMNEGLTFRA